MLPVCPKCDLGLIILQFQSVEVDYCANCRGIWLDAGEFEALLQLSGAEPISPLPAQATAGATRWLCPRCDAPMTQQRVGGDLVLESCPQGHGQWFDAGELPHLLQLCPNEANAARTIALLNDMFGQQSLNQEKLTCPESSSL